MDALKDTDYPSPPKKAGPHCGGTNCAQGDAACDWLGQAGQIWGGQRISFLRGGIRIHDPSHTSLEQRLIHHLLVFQASCFLVQRIPLLRKAAARFFQLISVIPCPAAGPSAD